MKEKKSASSAQEKQAKKKGKRISKKTGKIDFSDIPEISDAQLITMRRVGRPLIGELARQLIAIRIDPIILEKLQKEAKKKGKGYQSLINEILAAHVQH